MIRLGICTDEHHAAALKEMGYDYFELSMNRMAAFTEAEFDALRADCAQTGLVCEVMNCMLPSSLAVTGEHVDEAALRAYLDHAFGRASLLGVQVVVFGSGASRRVPDGFPFDEAWRQIAAFLRLADAYAEKYGLTIAIEPLNTVECNILNYVSEATALCALLETAHVRALGDYYHMAAGKESVAALTHAGQSLAHVHIACPGARTYPLPGDGADYASLFDALRRAGYEGRVSIEGAAKDFAADAKAAFALLDALRR